MTDTDDRGHALHREFVGMLFALAIAEVAIQSGTILNSDVDPWTKVPALAHLILAAMVIATSWVGWGWSKTSLSNVTHVFTWDFVELLLDVWLVGVYFFLVQGAEKLTEVNGVPAIHGSASIEAFWIMVMFVTYAFWDVFTKWRQAEVLVQRGWASFVCAAMAIVTLFAVHELHATWQVVLGDLSLLTMVLLFRAMKLHDLRDHPARSWVRMAGLFGVWLASTVLARS